MHPDEALENLRRLSHQWKETEGAPAIGSALVDAFTSLDGWLSNGGFRPNEWRPKATLGPGAMDRIRVAVNADPGATPIEVAELVEASMRSLATLATMQANELARKDAALDRAKAAIEDAQRPSQFEPPEPT